LFRSPARVVEGDIAKVPRQAASREAGIVKIKRSAQNPNATTLVQRAYQLARSGAFAGWAEISDRLKREGYTATSVNVHLEGKAIRADLKRICDEAKGV
jgi:hypothetical protein